MQTKTAELKKDNGPHKKLEDWIEAGNQLHDQAIFDFFVRLLPIGALWLKQKTSTIEIADLRSRLRMSHS